jgi:c(7)-type cytochrome triheme protein
VGNKSWRILIISVCIVCFMALGVAFAQKKVGGGDIKYEAKEKGAVLFSHETHVNTHKAKCAECHPKVFKMKKEAKITKAETKYCSVCHDGKKAFGLTAEADCAKCHKK